MNCYFQLFSARNTALDDALRIIAETGYAGVEAYKDNFNDTPAFKASLAKYGLNLPSMHINLELLRDDMEACLRRARDFDCSHIVCPYLMPDDRPTDASGWQALARELAEIEKQFGDAGCSFSWHNHDFEFVPLEDGSMPIEHLLDTANSLKWEIDVAWIVRAKADPAPWIQQYQSRISAIHLKDVAPQGQCIDEDGWADLGEGVVAWKNLMPLLRQSAADLYITEHDNPSDLQRFADRSIRAAQAFLA